MDTNLTLKQELDLAELEDKPQMYKLKQRQVKREIMKMQIKIKDYEQSISLLDDEIEQAQKDYTDYQNSLK